MDDPQTDFVHMIVERQQKCEAEIDLLKCQIEDKLPDLFLNPDCNFEYFNDGYRLIWKLFDTAIQLRTSKQNGNKLIPLDESHANAIVNEKGILCMLPLHDKRIFFIGHPMKILKLRDFIDQIEDIMIDRKMVGSNLTWREYLGTNHNYIYPNFKCEYCYRSLVRFSEDRFEFLLKN